jgi:hypothetical protein
MTVELQFAKCAKFPANPQLFCSFVAVSIVNNPMTTTDFNSKGVTYI